MFICTVPRRPHTQTGGAGDKCGGGGGDATGDTQGGDGSDDVAGGGGSGEAAGELCACRTDDPLRSHSVLDYAANILPHRRIYCRTDDPLRSHSLDSRGPFPCELYCRTDEYTAAPTTPSGPTRPTRLTPARLTPARLRPAQYRRHGGSGAGA